MREFKKSPYKTGPVVSRNEEETGGIQGFLPGLINQAENVLEFLDEKV
jgi:hypothetical protein